MRERAARELDAFMNALDEVEQLGSSLAHLPRARLLEIQRVLRDGVSGPNGQDIIPAVQSRLHADIDETVAAVAEHARWRSGRPPHSRTLSHQQERRALRAQSEAPGGLEHQAVSTGALPPRRGLTPSELGQLPRFVLGEGDGGGGDADGTDTCAICLGDMAVGDTLAVLGCAHRFHHACCAKWLALSHVCPLCKRHALTGEAAVEPAEAVEAEEGRHERTPAQQRARAGAGVGGGVGDDGAGRAPGSRGVVVVGDHVDARDLLRQAAAAMDASRAASAASAAAAMDAAASDGGDAEAAGAGGFPSAATAVFPPRRPLPGGAPAASRHESRTTTAAHHAASRPREPRLTVVAVPGARPRLQPLQASRSLAAPPIGGGTRSDLVVAPLAQHPRTRTTPSALL